MTKATNESKHADAAMYKSAVGKLLYKYLATTTRPDIVFAVSNVAKFTSKPTEHWTAVKHILRYLVGSVNYGLLFIKEESFSFIGYSDADWGSDITDRK